MSAQTWTANHISKRTMYFAYDEAGQLLSCHDTYEEAQEALIKYAQNLEDGRTETITKYFKPTKNTNEEAGA